jgi:hypothetical protein
MLTDQEREAALALLVQSRTTVLNAVEGVTENQARWKPAPERWSILEYIEHLAVSDDALVGLVEQALVLPAHHETDAERNAREKKRRETVIPRGGNPAPENLKPATRFGSLAEAVSAFLAARERTLAYARSTTGDLRKHFMPHPVVGPLDAYQWLCANAGHSESHSAHVREIRAMQDFPQ